MSYVYERFLLSEEVLLVWDQLWVVVQLLHHEEMLRVQELILDVILEGIVPHDDDGVLEEVDCVLLDYVGQSVLSDVEHL